jgi:hypothetical protein
MQHAIGQGRAEGLVAVVVAVMVREFGFFKRGHMGRNITSKISNP